MQWGGTRVTSEDLKEMLASKAHLGNYSQDMSRLLGEAVDGYSRREPYGEFQLAFWKRSYQDGNLQFWVDMKFIPSTGSLTETTRVFKLCKDTKTIAETAKRVRTFAKTVFGIKDIVWNHATR